MESCTKIGSSECPKYKFFLCVIAPNFGLNFITHLHILSYLTISQLQDVKKNILVMFSSNLFKG